MVGEAGIGKSRMVQALREEIADVPHTVLCYQCSPHYVNTALHPMIEHMQRAAGIGPEDTGANKLEKLSTWLGAGSMAHDALILLGALLSIPADPRAMRPAMSPQRQKELTFDLLLRLMQRLAEDRPLYVVFEDVHWADPTTLEFLTMLIGRVHDMRALVALTFRPEFVPPWTNQPHVEQLELKNLAPEHALELTKQVAAEQLPPLLIEQVVAKTDGVPLFVEELTRAVLGSAPLSEQLDGSTSDASSSSLSIPSTLQDSLMARLDQLGPQSSSLRLPAQSAASLVLNCLKQ